MYILLASYIYIATLQLATVYHTVLQKYPCIATIHVIQYCDVRRHTTDIICGYITDNIAYHIAN